MRSTTVFVTSMTCVLWGCGDGQTGADYQGEPLMSLRGEVTSSELALTEDLVPAVTFQNMVQHLIGINVSGTDSIYYVKGAVDGTFPSAFTLRLYDPPPAAASISKVGGESDVAFGEIAAIASDHPTSLKEDVTIETHADGSWVRVAKICDNTGACLERSLADCAPIPPASSDADPVSEDWPCGSVFPDNSHWSSFGRSSQYYVMYFGQAAPAGGVLSHYYAAGAAISAGYHVVTQDPTRTPDDTCIADAQLQAIDEINQTYGTHGSPEHFEDFTSTPEIYTDYFWRRVLIDAVANGCETGNVMLTDASEPVQLNLTNTPEFLPLF